MIRKRLLSACLALALCLGLLPVTALAAGNDSPHSLYVGNTNFASTIYPDNAAYWTSSDGGTNWTLQQEKPTGDSYIYYNGQGTLTLHNANIQGQYDSSNGYSGYGIYAVGASGSAVSLTIKLEGTNTVSGWSGIFVHAVDGAASLSISGTGSLAAEGTGGGSFSGIVVQGNGGKAELTINNVDVTATNNGAQGIGLQSAGTSPATLAVNGGSLTASGSKGIDYQFGTGTTGSGTPTVTVSNNAIVRANGGIANTSSTSIQYGTGNGENGGIVFDGNTGTVYGNVTLQENLEIGEGESLTIPEGASLTIGSGATLTVDGGKLTGTVTGDVTYKVTGVSLSPTTLTLDVGGTATLTATVEPDNATNQNVTWSSDPNDIVTIVPSTDTKTATITATGTGTTTIKATVDGKSAQCTVTVTEAANVPVTSVSLDKTTLGLTEGKTAQLNATVLPENATNKNVTWESSNTSVATVDANGLVTAVSAGTATITATTVDQSKTATCTVTVKPAEYTVTVLADGKGSASASPATAEAGTTVTLTADPDNGWRFSRWEVVEGDVTISGNSFTMPAENVTVRAVFSPIVNLPDTYDIDLIVGEGGEAKLSLTNASEGSTITVTATPDEGFELDYITVDGERIDGTTFTMPAHDVTVRVYFTDGSATLPFTDVSAGAWYYDAVGYVYVGGLMDGVSDTLFDPDGTMTRAMVWAILARVDGETVTGEDWIETAREWAVANGVSDGENATDYVTREQFATMLWRYASGKGYDVSIGEDTNILSYADFADLSEYAIPAMQWACGAGIVNGTSESTLAPQGEATRAQVAAMLMRFVEAIG